MTSAVLIYLSHFEPGDSQSGKHGRRAQRHQPDTQCGKPWAKEPGDERIAALWIEIEPYETKTQKSGRGQIHPRTGARLLISAKYNTDVQNGARKNTTSNSAPCTY